MQYWCSPAWFQYNESLLALRAQFACGAAVCFRMFCALVFLEVERGAISWLQGRGFTAHAPVLIDVLGVGLSSSPLVSGGHMPGAFSLVQRECHD